MFIVMPFWYFVKTFVNEIARIARNDKFVNFSQWKYIKQRYLMVRDYTDLVNEIIWPNVFVHTVLNFAYFPFKLELLKGSGELFYSLQFLAVCANLGCFYYLAADACRQVGFL